jgi:hypothetical protein
MAVTSSSVSGIIASMKRAVRRHTVHQVPTITGCMITRAMLTMPSGTTRMPKSTTIQGIVRQRSVPPMKPIRYSSA